MSLPLSQIIIRPSLWGEALRSWWAIRRRGTFSINHGYLAWRRETAYGDPGAVESVDDLRAYLRWRRRQRRLGP